MGRDMPPKCLFPLGDSNPHLIHDFFGPTRVHIPDGISIDSAVLARLMVVMHRHTQTDTQTTEHQQQRRIFAVRSCDAANAVCVLDAEKAYRQSLKPYFTMFTMNFPADTIWLNF